MLSGSGDVMLITKADLEGYWSPSRGNEVTRSGLMIAKLSCSKTSWTIMLLQRSYCFDKDAWLKYVNAKNNNIFSFFMCCNMLSFFSIIVLNILLCMNYTLKYIPISSIVVSYFLLFEYYILKIYLTTVEIVLHLDDVVSGLHLSKLKL